MAATIGYGMLAYVIATYWRPRGLKRRYLYLAATILALAVGVSRIYLGVHFPTDVIGGFAAGTAWLAICVTGTRIARETPRRRRARGTGNEPVVPNVLSCPVPGANPPRDASRSRPSTAP
jgi:membrane-associated phospholipid phosphatase